METVVLTNPIDMHIHLRQDELLRTVLPYSATYFSACLAMPNLIPPLMTTESVLQYKQQIMQESHTAILDTHLKQTRHFIPLMSLYIHDNLNVAEIHKASQHGIKILKLYPKGATTNAQNGVSKVLNPHLLHLLEEAQKHNMILSIHGESAGFSMEREKEFLEIFEELARCFPKLKIIIEHLSDRHSLESIHKYTNLFGTITLHHLLLTLDDILGAMLNPFMFCKPIAKTPLDRDAILQTALSADSKFSFGSDSAPHTVAAKMNGAAGIFSAPILLQALCSIFMKHNKIENLQKFISDNALCIYNLTIPFTKHVILHKKPYTFGNTIRCGNDDIMVFMGDKRLEYSIEDIKVS